MTLAHPHRILAAAALLGALLVPVAASADGGHNGHNGNGGHWSESGRVHLRHHRGHGPEVRPHEVSGTITALSTGAALTTLMLQTVGGISITVTTPATATVVRHYNGASSLDEMAVGDHISAWGSFENGENGTGTFDATRLKDWSIQRADSRVVGQVQSVASNVITISVGHGYGHTHGHGRRNPYHHDESVQVTISSSTIVMSGSVTVTAGLIQQGMRIMAMGTYDRVSHTLNATKVRILASHGEQSSTDLNPSPESDATATATQTPVTEATAVATDTVTSTDTIAATSTATPTPSS